MPDPAESVGLVLDTSVWINLLATEAMEAILRALAVPCYAPEQVVTEVRRHPSTGTAFPTESHPLRQMSQMSRFSRSKVMSWICFSKSWARRPATRLGMVKQRPSSWRASRGLDLIVDDRKARRIRREDLPNHASTGPSICCERVRLSPLLVARRSTHVSQGRVALDACTCLAPNFRFKQGLRGAAAGARRRRDGRRAHL